MKTHVLLPHLVCLPLLLLSSCASGGGGGGAGRAPRITEHPSDMTVARNDPVTLKCSADGNPAPGIEWYRDGELVISSSSSSSSAASSGAGSGAAGHRIMLPGGDLFFFRVILSRKESDAGVYWCLARNVHGATRSRNATLTVAYLQSDFRTAPVHTRGILGEPATLECEPPRGHPEPAVIWKKDGQLVDTSSAATSVARVRLEENGNLYIAKLIAEDEGRYQCLAQNVVGTRETPVALLSVHVRPVIVRPPQDSVALIGGEATLECGVKGDPPPHVEWRRQDGVKIPVDRLKPVDGGAKTSLRLVRLVPSDAARYVCEAENSVGSSAASAQLTVLIPPSWNSSAGQVLPREMRVNLDSSVYIDCPVQGSPAPLIFWRRDGQGRRPGSSVELMTSDAPRSHRRWSVFHNGTLLISRAKREDAGSVWCGAVSEAGGLIARTRIDVVVASAASAPPMPPVIEYGPVNQTVPLGSQAYLACSAATDANKTPVRWWKDGQLVAYTDRIKLDKENGALRIDDVQSADYGRYTCWLGKDDAAASGWTASLARHNDTTTTAAAATVGARATVGSRLGAFDPLTLPGSPSQPRLLERTWHSITFAWQNGSRAGSSPLLGYVVEVFSSADDVPNSWTWAADASGNSKQWRIVRRYLLDDKLVLDDLQPGTSYAVMVRAENSHGLSLPSPVSPWFTTLAWSGAADDDAAFDADGSPDGDADVRTCLSSSFAPLLHLDAVRPLNGTSARLHWRWLDSVPGGDGDFASASHGPSGAYIFYRHAPNSSGKRRSNESVLAPFRADVVLRASHITSFTVTNLTPSLRYSFFMVPFCRAVEGRPSNSLSASMPEAAPDGPPRDLHIRQLNLTSCLVKWSEPLAHQQNGVVTGYQIYVLAYEFETLLANMTLPASPTSVIIGNLVAGSAYLIRAAAWTSAGLGPPTEPVSFAMEASSFPHNTLTPPADDLYNYSDEVYTNGGGGGGGGGERNGDRQRPDAGIPANIVHEKWFILAIGGVALAILTLIVIGLFVKRYWWRAKSAPSVQKSEFYGGSSTEAGGGGVFNNGARNTAGARDGLWVRQARSGHEPKYTYKFETAPGDKKDSGMEAHSSLLAHESRSGYGVIAPPEYAELLNHNDSKMMAHETDHGQLSLSSFLPMQQQQQQQSYEMTKHVHQPSAYATTTLISASPREPYSQYPGSSSSSSEQSSKASSHLSPKLRANVMDFMDHQRAPNLTDFLPLPPRYPPPPTSSSSGNAIVFSEMSEDDGSLPMPRKSPYKFSSAAPSPALSKRSAPATPMSVPSRANRLNNQQDQEAAIKRQQHNGNSSATRSKGGAPKTGSFNKLDDGCGYYGKSHRTEASIDSFDTKYHYGNRNRDHHHRNDAMAAYETQDAVRCELPLRSPVPRCRVNK